MTATPGPEPADAPTIAPAARRSSRAAHAVRRVAAQYSGVGIVLIVLVTYLAITQQNFATWDNVSIILQQQAVLLVVAVGLTFVMIVGGLDLSMGGVLALAGVLTWKFLEWGVPVPLTVVLVTGTGFLLGALVNGMLIARLRLSFLVVTLGTGGAFTALALLITNGQTQSLLSVTGLTVIGTSGIGSLPWIVVISLGLLVVSALVLRYTGFGRMIYATGGNEEAARLAGIDVATVRTVVYGIAACLASVAGVLQAAHLASADPQAGQFVVLEAAAAVLIGGTSFMGGSGTMLGTFLGVLFLGVLSNGLTRLDISAYWNGFITGAVLVFALLIDRLRFRGVR